MKNPLHTCTNKPALIVLSGFFSVILSTASVAQTTSGQIDTAAVTDIEVRIADNHPDQFGFTLPLQQMLERVANNLAQWHFPVSVSPKKNYSHTLEAYIGLIKNDKTPVGFSFSIGNSDPRATDFQKADVIPVSCRLTANDNLKQSVELEMSFSAKQLLKGSKPHADQAKIVDKLVEDLSTVCFDLLDDLKWTKPEQHSVPGLIQPNWMPQVKIETVPEPVPPATPDKTAVHSEINNSEERKQIIIHNQGTPLILKFGPDR
ncbi:MAG: hypothetical protein ACXWTS_09745 [Methylococcaceae bacterium]